MFTENREYKKNIKRKAWRLSSNFLFNYIAQPHLETVTKDNSFIKKAYKNLRLCKLHLASALPNNMYKII